MCAALGWRASAECATATRLPALLSPHAPGLEHTCPSAPWDALQGALRRRCRPPPALPALPPASPQAQRSRQRRRRRRRPLQPSSSSSGGGRAALCCTTTHSIHSAVWLALRLALEPPLLTSLLTERHDPAPMLRWPPDKACSQQSRITAAQYRPPVLVIFTVA